MNDTPADNAALVAEHWARKLESAGDFSPDVYWLAIPRVVRHYMRGATRGGDAKTAGSTTACSSIWPGELRSSGCSASAVAGANSSATSPCFRRSSTATPGISSQGAIDTARRLAGQENRHNIHYAVRDANTAEIAPARYDAIWFNNSLHHIESLERVCEHVARGLKPDGWLFLNEYVGPNLFDMPPRQKEAIRAAFALIPRRLRRRRGPDCRTEIAESPAIPCPAETVAADPSEAVRSADILDVVGHYFDIVEQNPAGGTILQFLLHGIAGNFQPEDQESMEVLDTLLRIERSLIQAGDLASDFAVVAARRRARPALPRVPPPSRPIARA